MKNLVLLLSVVTLLTVNSTYASESQAKDCSAYAESTERNGKAITESKGELESETNEAISE